MEFCPAPFSSSAQRRTVAGWRYAPPYDVYDQKGEMPDTDVSLFGLFSPDGSLGGFFRAGRAARIGGAEALYAAPPDALDFAMGLAPELTGQGRGLAAADAALSFLRDRFHPPYFRLAVHLWNLRARKVWQRLGFSPFAAHGDFLLMLRDERPWRDVTRPLENGMPVYPDDPPFERRLYYHKQDCGWDMSLLSMTAHAGTHLDAPAHIGLPGDTESIDVNKLSGPARLIDWTGEKPDGLYAPRVLLKTGERGITEDDARRLVADGVVQMVGVDALSVGIWEEVYPVHLFLLSRGIIILENLSLAALTPGWYDMRCLPLRIPGSDGAPARVLLREMASFHA